MKPFGYEGLRFSFPCSVFMMECLKEFYMTYDDTRLRWNGADLLTRVARRFLSIRNKSVRQLELNVQPSFMFFPIAPQNISRCASASCSLYMFKGCSGYVLLKCFLGHGCHLFRFLFMSLCSHLVFKENNSKRFYAILKHAWLHK